MLLDVDWEVVLSVPSASCGKHTMRWRAEQWKSCSDSRTTPRLLRNSRATRTTCPRHATSLLRYNEWPAPHATALRLVRPLVSGSLLR